MIFGKTDNQLEAERQERLKALYDKRIKRFAWWPVTLCDGRTAWLSYVYKQFNVWKSPHGGYGTTGWGMYYAEDKL